MAKERFIRGKHDRGHHDGRHANIKREIEAMELWCEVWQELVEAVEKGTLESEDGFGPVLDKKGVTVYSIGTSGKPAALREGG